jgi:hypothetical protein
VSPARVGVGTPGGPRRRGLATLLLAAAVALLPGCAAAVPVLSAASTGAAAGQAGYSFWRSGKLTYVDEGTLDQMNEAVAITIDRFDLQTHGLHDEIDGGRLRHRWWSIRTDRGHLLTIKVEPLTDAMIEVQLDVGFFGNKAAAELLADRFKQELDHLQASGRAPGVIVDPRSR